MKCNYGYIKLGLLILVVQFSKNVRALVSDRRSIAFDDNASKEVGSNLLFKTLDDNALKEVSNNLLFNSSQIAVMLEMKSSIRSIGW